MMHHYVGYSVTLKVEQSNGHRTFPAGSRLCVQKSRQGLLKLVKYAGCGYKDELELVKPEDVEIWKPEIGQRFWHVPEREPCVITSIENRGPGCHRAWFENLNKEYGVHDQELGAVLT